MLLVAIKNQKVAIQTDQENFMQSKGKGQSLNWTQKMQQH